MTTITINKIGGHVTIDGKALPVDLGEMDPSISVVQWNGEVGWIEYINDPFAPADYKGNEPITDISAFQFAIDAWHIENEKPPPAPPVIVPSAESVMLFDHENRLRSMEGLPPLTLAEFTKATKPPPPR